LNGTHQLFAFAANVKIVAENIHTMQKKNTHTHPKALLDGSEELGLEVNPNITKYILMSHQKAGQRHNIKTANRSFEEVAKFEYLGTTLTDQNCMHA
jgi:hypothetical protein